MTQPQPFQDIADNFAYLDSWEDRYHYLIELGEALPHLSDDEKSASNKINECASKAWLVTEIEQSEDGYRLNYRGESDSKITHGLMAIAISLYSGRSAKDIVATDALQAIRDIGLEEHVTPQRSNGLIAMINRIRREASALS